jgi:type 1 glutamine amidotransferase
MAFLVILLFSMEGLRAEDHSAQRRSALVMMGSYDTYHMKPEQTEAVAGLLTGYNQLAAHFSDNAADFTFENIRKYDLVILFSGLSREADDKELTHKALQNIFRAVEAGTPLLAMHGGFHITTRDGGSEIQEKIGAKYNEASHYPYQRFNIELDQSHPITQGVENFQALDEPYLLDMTASDVSILATYNPQLVAKASLLPAPPEHPTEGNILSHEWAKTHIQATVLYTREIGKGKIVVNFLGHDEQTLYSPSYRTLTKQSIEWLLGER